MSRPAPSRGICRDHIDTASYLSATHGGDGPLWCSDIRHTHELIERIIAGAGELGIRRTDDFNDGDQEGVGDYQLFTRNSLRCSTAVAYLRPTEGRPNLRVETDAHATGLILEGKRAGGVRARQHDREVEVRAKREVVLAAGALQSPQLLLLSGIAPRGPCARTASPCGMNWPASARTCRTTSRSG